MEYSLIGLFFIGFLIALTPCVLPILPITYKTLSYQNNGKLAAFVYTLGLSSSYASLGLFLSYFGAELNLQFWLQQPFMIIIMSLFFIILGLSMFEITFFSISHKITNLSNTILNKINPDKPVNVFFIGVLSAFLLSPCITAPLAAVLIYISQTNNILLGFWGLFVLGLGMGLPIILISFGLNNWLPKQSFIMKFVKAFIGFVMILLGIWLTIRLYIDDYTVIFLITIILIFSFLLIISAFYKKILYLALSGLLTSAIGLIVLYEEGYFLDSVDSFIEYTVIEPTELDPLIGNPNNDYILIDFYADWCAPCLKMERTIFKNPEVHKLLRDDIIYTKMDVTGATDGQRKFMDELNIFGPPAVVIFSNQGELIDIHAGDLGPMEFLEFINFKQ